MKLLMILACTLALSACSEPFGPSAGGALQGAKADTPASWVIVDGVEHVQLETINKGKPRSVLIWVGTADDRLYVATSLISGSNNPADRTWVKNVMNNPNIRLRVQDEIYRLKAVRVVEPVRLEIARSALMLKYEVAVDEQSSSAWVYELQAR
jgi:hypothetical protein